MADAGMDSWSIFRKSTERLRCLRCELLYGCRAAEVGLAALGQAVAPLRQTHVRTRS